MDTNPLHGKDSYPLVIDKADYLRPAKKTKLPTLPKGWPPPSWESHLVPANDGMEAIWQWLSLWTETIPFIEKMQTNSGKPTSDLGGQIVRDTFRLIEHMKAKGVAVPAIHEEPRNYSIHDALVILRHVRNHGGSRSPRQSAAAEHGSPPDEDGPGFLQKAMLLLLAHPDWPIRKIAQNLGLSRATFYRHAKGVSVLRALLEARHGDRRHFAHGQRMSDGRIEAWEEER